MSGEIDTAAPISSVKAAVSLFGEVGTGLAPPITRRSSSDERVLEMETRHQMKLIELHHYKDHLHSAQIAKARAQKDLQRANRSLQQLKTRLETVNQLKKACIKAGEAANIRAQVLEAQKTQRAHLCSNALENEREGQKASVSQLIAYKQELDNLRQDFHSEVEQKATVFQKAEEAQRKAHADQERRSQLENEVKALRRMLGKLQLVSREDSEENSRNITDKESWLRGFKLAKEEAEREIKHMREEYESTETLQEKLEETTEALKTLEKQVKELHSSEDTFLELENSLEETLEEEKTLRSSIDSIKQELEEVKNECLELEKKVLEAESSVERMQAELEKRKIELSIYELVSETKHAMLETEESKGKAELLQKEAEALRLTTEEAEEKLKAALEEAEAAKKVADDKVYNYSGPVREIRMPAEEFESMGMKIEGLKTEADVKVATAMAERECVATREKAISQKVAGVLEENEAIEAGIKDAVKREEMAEAATRMIEEELRKWKSEAK